MREHQIVITLKPEQFLEVQRLARAAGAKSMGMFVRQKLLSGLGIIGGPPEVGAAQPSEDLLKLVEELRRLHGELKIFVAESLARSYTDEGQPDDPIAQAADNLLDQALQNFDTHDELEQLVQQTFTISPRLGPLASPGGFDQPMPGRNDHNLLTADEETNEFGLDEEEDAIEEEEISVAISLPGTPAQQSPAKPAAPTAAAQSPVVQPNSSPAVPPPPPPTPAHPPGFSPTGAPPPKKRL